MHVYGFHPGHLSSVTAFTDRSQPAFAGALPPHPLPERALYGGPKGYVVTFTRTPVAELAGTPLRIQVLCPGPTATEFHRSRGDKPVAGRDQSVHEDGGMPVDQVIDASMTALGAGEVVCVPGLDDPALIDGLTEAEPLDTFPIVRRKDEAKYGSYRTKGLILAEYDRMAAARLTLETPLVEGENYTSTLTPPPGHGPRHPA